MSQPKFSLDETLLGEEWFIDIIHDSGDGYISSAKTKKTAYKRAAAKLRKLADEAERLAEES